MARIGILRETKNKFERRTALTPSAVKRLVLQGHEVLVQPSEIRIFQEDDYRQAGATIQEDLSGCGFVFGVKEVPVSAIVPGAVHIFFSHTVKAQAYNMEMLQAFIDQKATIVDYELLTDETGKRLVFFGNFAGLAGAVDSLHLLGQKLAARGINSPLQDLRPSLGYKSLQEAKQHIRETGYRLQTEPLPASLGPLTVLVAGYGNVAKGCFEILDCLPVDYVDPAGLPGLLENSRTDRIYVSVLKEEHLVKQKASGGFDLAEYFKHPDRYESIMDPLVGYAHLFLNAIYWTPACPTFLTRKRVRELYQQGNEHPLVVGDITCDIEGSVEFTVKATNPGKPTFRWLPLEDKVIDDDGPEGVTILAVDTLPCEFPADSSDFFCAQLETVMGRILDMNPADPGICSDGLLTRSMICHSGRLTEPFSYLQEHLPV